MESLSVFDIIGVLLFLIWSIFFWFCFYRDFLHHSCEDLDNEEEKEK